MNDYLLSLILGVVEGITEFLPVSSTAHLRIVEAMLHISMTSGYWKMYTIVIQLGAILSSAGLFPQPHREISFDISQGRKRRP